mmetsp:Transcript_1043/g.3331  ORF Transcript_1043/g.3331 Transcript_1043/m.3331 type:complete len:200 (+) Transcript_1043:645-1244(+)
MRRRHVAASDEHVWVLVLVDAIVQLREGRRARGDRLGHLGVDALARGHLDRLELRIRHPRLVRQPRARLVHRIALLAHTAHLGAVAVCDARVGHRVAVVTVRVEFEHEWALPGTAVRRRVLDRLAHGEHVHPVRAEARHVLTAFVILGHGRAALGRGAHPIAVVLTHKDARQLPQSRHVHRLEELPLVRSTVAVQGEGH